jgi:hypothetical protein
MSVTEIVMEIVKEVEVYDVVSGDINELFANDGEKLTT